MCIRKNEAFVFSVSKEHYPIYDKDSLINTNEKFDYGAFAELKRMMESEQANVTIFAFTFLIPGIYDFVDSYNSDKHILVSVIGDGDVCPDEDIPLRTRTEASILTLGIK